MANSILTIILKIDNTCLSVFFRNNTLFNQYGLIRNVPVVIIIGTGRE